MMLLVMLRLNPCCSGRWSRTYKLPQIVARDLFVLILIVVEDGLVHIHPFSTTIGKAMS